MRSVAGKRHSALVVAPSAWRQRRPLLSGIDGQDDLVGCPIGTLRCIWSIRPVRSRAVEGGGPKGLAEFAHVVPVKVESGVRIAQILRRWRSPPGSVVLSDQIWHCYSAALVSFATYLEIPVRRIWRGGIEGYIQDSATMYWKIRSRLKPSGLQHRIEARISKSTDLPGESFQEAPGGKTI